MERAKLTLREILANKSWSRSDDPFPHFTAQNVFVKSIYLKLETAFQHILAQGLGGKYESGVARLSRNISGYDAYGLSFEPNFTGPLRIFLSRAWHDTLATLVGVRATRDLSGGLHHHRVGSRSGDVHNDFNPAYFADTHLPNGINIADSRLCDYKHGTHCRSGLRPRLCVRAVAMLFYLNNPTWSPGNGGETGLYRSSTDAVEQPTAVIPPINNSILIFECTPYSYHTFLRNHCHPRNSVILWLHSLAADAVSRWGKGKIVYWT
jgi:2OG-Fe(II) oxygenase superfamily